MKTTSWLWFVNGNFARLIFSFALLGFSISCSDDTANLDPDANDASAKAKANVNSTSSYSDYNILVDVS